MADMGLQEVGQQGVAGILSYVAYGRAGCVSCSTYLMRAVTSNELCQNSY